MNPANHLPVGVRSKLRSIGIFLVGRGRLGPGVQGVDVVRIRGMTGEVTGLELVEADPKRLCLENITPSRFRFQLWLCPYWSARKWLGPRSSNLPGLTPHLRWSPE